MDTLQGIGASAGSGGAESAAGGRPQHHTALAVPKPVIAAVNGACAGIGMVQALMCDIRFAAAGAKFTTAFSRRGLIAEYGMSWVLPRLIGTSRAMDLLFSGRVILAEEAAAMGLVSEVVPAEHLAHLDGRDEAAGVRRPDPQPGGVDRRRDRVDEGLAATR
jgi:enoyl-CoA hydratase/carnithine racemase